MKCQNCGYEVSANELFCGNCGQKVQQQNNEENIFCGECGAKVPFETRFCPECGKSLANQDIEENEDANKKKSKSLIIAIVSITAVIVALCVVLVYMMASVSSEKDIETENVEIDITENKQDEAAENEGQSEKNEDDEYRKKDIDESSNDDNIIMEEYELDDSEGIVDGNLQTYTPPVFNSAEASSMLGMSATGNEYYPSYVLDNDPSTCWASDYREGPNPSITLRAESTQLVSGVRFSNGYFKSEKVYNNNRRITKIQISYEGGSVEYTCEPEQYRVIQDVEFDSPIETNFITVKVLDSEAGADGWDDICISTIDVY